MSVSAKMHEGELVAGQMLGRYELLLPIGTGGMGKVWAARLLGTRGFRRLVAIKTVLGNLEDARLEQMLYREATFAAQIHHANVAQIYELGEQRGMLYLAMELVEGDSLSVILRAARQRGGVPLSVAVNLVGQVCEGLQAAHGLSDSDGNHLGLVHRDISPPNVLVTDTGTVKIIDFGVATTASSGTCRPGEVKGKISYLAPEQLRSEPLDARVDVFATGILLYLMTTGRHPFRATNEGETINRILSLSEVIAPSCFVKDYPSRLESVLLRALAKDREQRFASAAALLEALEHAWPDSFGLHGNRASAEYVRELLKERIAERREVLKHAEQLAERSGAHSAGTLPPEPKRRPARRHLLLTLPALGLGLVTASAAAHYFAAAGRSAGAGATDSASPPTLAGQSATTRLASQAQMAAFPALPAASARIAIRGETHSEPEMDRLFDEPSGADRRASGACAQGAVTPSRAKPRTLGRTTAEKKADAASSRIEATRADGAPRRSAPSTSALFVALEEPAGDATRRLLPVSPTPRTHDLSRVQSGLDGPSTKRTTSPAISGEDSLRAKPGAR